MDNPMTTASPGRGGIKGWVKKNKLVAGLIVSVAGFFFLSKKGASSGSSGSVVSADGTVSDGPVQLVPVSAPPSEGSTDTTVYPNDPPATGDQSTTDTTSGNEGGTADTGSTVVTPTATATNTDNPAPEAPSASTNATPAQQGVTVAGHFFAGATGHVMVSSGKNSFGTYSVHKISFPGRVEYWWHYNSGQSSGKWTGPHANSGTATVTATPRPPSTPTPVAHPATTAPSAPAAPAPSAPAAPTPIAAPNVFYNPTRNLRYIVRRHDNGRNYRHYESVLNRGDWGSRSDLIIPQ